MLKIVFREIAIFIVSVSIFPGAILILFLRGEIGQTQLMGLARELMSVDIAGFWPLLSLLMKMVAPYLLIQAMRAYKWSQASITGLRYANLYYALLSMGAVIWFWSQSLDLLYFMHAMDDLPAEIPQFINMEASNLLIGGISLYLSIRCFRVYLYALEPVNHINDRDKANDWSKAQIHD